MSSLNNKEYNRRLVKHVTEYNKKHRQEKINAVEKRAEEILLSAFTSIDKKPGVSVKENEKKIQEALDYYKK